MPHSQVLALTGVDLFTLQPCWHSMSLKHFLFTVLSQIQAVPPSQVLAPTGVYKLCWLSLVCILYTGTSVLPICVFSLWFCLPSLLCPPSLAGAGPNWCVQLPPAVSLLALRQQQPALPIFRLLTTLAFQPRPSPLLDEKNFTHIFWGGWED